MKKINLIFGVHNHQPVGNFDEVFELAVKSAYSPFLDVIEKHPKVKIVFHYTGSLLDWLEKNKPEIIARLKLLVESGQAEILTGGYYEPIMPVIPDRDKTGQIKKLTSYIKNNLSFTPKGLWLAERVWEPSLAKVLSEAGIEYIVLDDYHFLSTGIEEKKLRGYFVTEEQGTTLKIFPINQKLRYLMPFSQSEDSIKYLKDMASDNPSNLLVMADDGEKFGLWPDTYETCYEKKWLDKFLTGLEENSEWLTTMTFSEYLKKYPPAGSIYLPTASYFEMSEWSLPANAQTEFHDLAKHASPDTKRFIKGGFWRNFLTKYPESNNMHKRMLYVSEKAEGVRCEKTKNVKSKRSIEQAISHLYKAQCNCAYWHGIFGGLYFPHLRHAIYKNIIDAENCINPPTAARQPQIMVFDLDKDGQDEIVMENKNFSIYMKPHYGGAVFEMDFNPLGLNFTNTITRRFESYHKKVETAKVKKEPSEAIPLPDQIFAKEEGLKNYLKYDWFNRYSLMDHFLHPETTPDSFSKCEYGEQGDFTIEPYKPTILKNAVKLHRSGSVWCGGKKSPISVTKVIRFSSDNSISFEYEIKNLSEEKLSLWFGTEFNISFSKPDLQKEKGLKNFSVIDPGYNFKFDIDFSDNADVWTFPVYAVSLSEAGFEKMYQETSIFPNWKLEILPKTIWKTNFTLSTYPNT